MTTWVKVYNSMPQNPKVLMAGDRAAWLAICGLCYSNEHLTNGFIARHTLPVVAPGVKNPEVLAASLVAAELWHEVQGGWKIHDYQEHQRSAEEIRDRRSKDAERKAAARSNGSPHGQTADSALDSALDSAPNPSGVQAVPRAGDRGRSQDVDVDVEVEVEVEEQLVAATPPRGNEQRDDEEKVAYLCHVMSSEVRIAHSIPASSREALVAKGWPGACRQLLADGFTVEQIEYAIRWVCRHHYWRRRIKSMTRLRSEMEQVAKEIREQRERGGTVTPIRGKKETASDLLIAINGGAA